MGLVRTLVAFNTATDSDNKIHDDAVASRFGFTGGLVPGVDVHAYLTAAPLERWGLDWLDHGTIACRFGSPTYDGDTVEVWASQEADGSLTLELRRPADGATMATGAASLPDRAPLVDPMRWPAPAPPRPRPVASAAALGVEALGAVPFPLAAEVGREYLTAVRETDPVYLDRRLVHPGWLVRAANDILVRNVVLGPWIHVGSQVQHLGLAHLDEPLTVRALVMGVREHKGHGFVDLDVLVLGDADRPVARVAHTAIYEPRQVRETSRAAGGQP
jgi:acyl dehydratase